MNTLQDSIEKETLNADTNQDFCAISKAAVLLRSVKEKKKVLELFRLPMKTLKGQVIVLIFA